MYGIECANCTVSTRSPMPCASRSRPGQVGDHLCRGSEVMYRAEPSPCFGCAQLGYSIGRIEHISASRAVSSSREPRFEAAVHELPREAGELDARRDVSGADSLD